MVFQHPICWHGHPAVGKERRWLSFPNPKGVYKAGSKQSTANRANGTRDTAKQQRHFQMAGVGCKPGMIQVELAPGLHVSRAQTAFVGQNPAYRTKLRVKLILQGASAVCLKHLAMLGAPPHWHHWYMKALLKMGQSHSSLHERCVTPKAV